jgi:hypothetical protein
VDQPVPEGVRAAVVQVCRDAFYYRDDVRAVFIDAGCPETMYDKYDEPGNSKAKIACFVLSDLRGLGESGAIVQRKLIAELCRMDRPRPDADLAKGREALANLSGKRRNVGCLSIQSRQRPRCARRGPSNTNERRPDARSVSVLFVNASMTT